MIPLLVFQDHKAKKMICSGHENDGLYYLDHDGSVSFTSCFGCYHVSISVAFSFGSSVLSQTQVHHSYIESPVLSPAVDPSLFISNEPTSKIVIF